MFILKLTLKKKYSEILQIVAFSVVFSEYMNFSRLHIANNQIECCI